MTGILAESYVYSGFPTQFLQGGEQKHFCSQAYGAVQTGDNTAQEEGLRWDQSVSVDRVVFLG